MKKLVIFIIIYVIIALFVFSTKTNNIKEKMTNYAPVPVAQPVLTTDYVNIGCYNTYINTNTLAIPNWKGYVENIDTAKTMALSEMKPIFGLQSSSSLFFGTDLTEATTTKVNDPICSSASVALNSVWVNRKLLSDADKIKYDSIVAQPVLSTDYVKIGCYNTLEIPIPDGFVNDVEEAKRAAEKYKTPMFGLQDSSFLGKSYIYVGTNFTNATKTKVDDSKCSSGLDGSPKKNVWVYKK
jgi:hypothetical protein